MGNGRSFNRWIISGASVLACLLASACGGGSGGSAASPAPKRNFTVRLSPADTRLARRMLVQVADLGVDWYPGKRVAVGAGAQCFVKLNPPVIRTGDSGRAIRYRQTHGLEVQSSADVYQTPDQAHLALGTYGSKQFLDCYRAAFVHELTRSRTGNVTFGSPSVEKEALSVNATEHVAFRVTVPYTVLGHQHTILADALALREGRALAQLVFLSLDQPFPSDIQQRTAQIVADRTLQAQNPSGTPVMTTAQAGSILDLWNSFVDLHNAYTKAINNCFTSATSATQFKSCAEPAYHRSGLPAKDAQLALAYAQLAGDVDGTCGRALAALSAQMRIEQRLEARLHQLMTTPTTPSSTLIAAFHADDRHVDRMENAVTTVQNQCPLAGLQ